MDSGNDDDGNGNDGNNNNNNNNYNHPNAMCYAVEGDDDDNHSGDGDDMTAGKSTTMGCSADGRFVVAQFQGQTCDGSLFESTVQDLPQYNRDMKRNFGCRQIWARRRDWKDVEWFYDQTDDNGNGGGGDGGANDEVNRRRNRHLRGDDGDAKAWTNGTTALDVAAALEATPEQDHASNTTTTTTTEQQRALEGGDNNDDDNNNYSKFPTVPAWLLLRNAWACDVSLYPRGCPDPYHLKRKYDGVLAAAGNGHSVVLALMHYRLRMPLVALSILAGLAGTVLHVTAYVLSRREKFRAVGVCTTLGEDIKQVCVSMAKFLKKTIKMCCGWRGRKKNKNKSPSSPLSARSGSGRRRKRKNKKSKASPSSQSTKSDSYFSF